MSSKQAWRTTMMPDVATRSSITPYTIFWGATGLDAAAAAGVGSVRCQEVVGPWIVGSGRRLATGDHPTHRTRGHSMGEAWIIDAVRTPRGVGKPGKGALAHLHPQRLGSTVLRALAERTDLATADVDDVVWGPRLQVGHKSGDLGRRDDIA